MNEHINKFEIIKLFRENKRNYSLDTIVFVKNI